MKPEISAYQYALLNSDLKEIRLLHILDDTTTDTVCTSNSYDASIFRCQLVHVQLEQSPAFSALSYAWGNSGQKK